MGRLQDAQIQAREIALESEMRQKELALKAIELDYKYPEATNTMQKMMGVDEPDYGHLLDDMQYFEHTPIDAKKLCFPRVEEQDEIEGGLTGPDPVQKKMAAS